MKNLEKKIKPFFVSLTVFQACSVCGRALLRNGEFYDCVGVRQT